MNSVLQDWVMELPLREQGTLLTAVRGCDDEPKAWTARGFAESPGRRLTAFIRWCFMNPADPREVDIPGAFFQSEPPQPFRPSEFGHLPQHWYAHAMHALEVIGYRHPDGHVAGVAAALYGMMVHNLHLGARGSRSDDRAALRGPDGERDGGLVTPAQQQKRRRGLHAMPIADLRRLYAKRAGRLIFEVRAMTKGLRDDGRQVMVDGIIRIEAGQ